jgi:CHAT domain-containing protein
MEDLLGSQLLAGVRMVVLSACDTGVAEAQRLPDEMISLAAGFLEAGAAGVVGTLWWVDDFATSLLMRQFYRLHRSQGLSPAAALAGAQRWLRGLTNAELTRLLEENGKASPADLTAAREHVRQRWRQQTLNPDPKDQPFAAPDYWAGYCFDGA